VRQFFNDLDFKLAFFLQKSCKMGCRGEPLFRIRPGVYPLGDLRPAHPIPPLYLLLPPPGGRVNGGAYAIESDMLL